MPTTPQKPPLQLRDYLELDPNSSDSSSSNGFASFPRKPCHACSFTTVRFLLEAERTADLPRSRSSSKPSSPLTKLAAVFKNLPLSSPTRPSSSSLSRSLSKGLQSKKNFWRKLSFGKNKETTKEEEIIKGASSVVTTVKDLVRLNSFELYGDLDRGSIYTPSPIVSSSSSSSRSSCSSHDEDDAEQGSVSFLTSFSSGGSSSAASDFFSLGGEARMKSPRPSCRQSPDQESERRECIECQSEEESEKEQLSPVSVMDFPCEEEEEEDDADADTADGRSSSAGSDSPCFEQNLAKIESTTHQLLQKIRRFESLAELVDPHNLDHTFASSEEDEHRGDSDADDDLHVDTTEEIAAWDLIRRLRASHHVGPHIEKLLLDFFVEELSWSPAASTADIERLALTASEWIDGRGFLKPEEHGGAQLREIERHGGWRCVGGEKDEVAADVEARVLGSLLQELVVDLVGAEFCNLPCFGRA